MKNSFPNNDTLELIARVLSGNGSESDSNAMSEWRSLSRENDLEYNRCKLLWEKSVQSDQKFPVIDTERELTYFKRKIVPQEVKPDISSGRRISFRRFSVAATIIIAVSLSIFTLIKSKEFVTIKAGEVVSYNILPDGTALALYPGSVVKYKRDLKGSNREISLKGESFFEVERDTLRPFVVNSEDLRVEVLGTSFNISNYDKSSAATVIVQEGSVAVKATKGAKDGVILSAGDMVSKLSSGDELVKSRNTDPNYAAWKTREIQFFNSDMEEVCSVLSKVYNISVSYELTATENILTVKFEMNDLDYVISTIETTLDIKAYYEGEKRIVFR